MNNKIFDLYLESVCDERPFEPQKFIQFEYNYKKFFPKQTDSKILDIGVGRGEMLICMRDWGYSNYNGVDISKSTIKHCQKHNLNCELTDNTVLWLQNHQGEFDLITMLDVLEHIKKEDTIIFLQALRTSLKKNGKLIIQLPNMQSPDSQLHHFNDFTHEVGFVEHSLKQVLLLAGFTNLHFFGFEEFSRNNFKEIIKKILRFFYWKIVRFTRAISGNGNPSILNPVFCVIAFKENE